MHAKSDSEVTSLAPSSPGRSPRRPLYYVQSPSQHDAEKMSFQSSPMGSPAHHHFQYHCSPIHHSRESSTTRFSASLKNPKNGAWRRMAHGQEADGDEEDEEDVDGGFGDGWKRTSMARFYFICFLLSLVLLFTAFSLILWGASKPYKPRIVMKSIVFESFNVQAGMDGSGVPTRMLSINSTVRIFFRNPSTFFGVHVTSTPLELYYYQLQIASGNIKRFYQSRKSQRVISVTVQGTQIPLYGGGSSLTSSKENPINVPLDLTFIVRSRAYVLGKLVKPKFYRKIHCSVTLREKQLGKRIGMKNLCEYD